LKIKELLSTVFKQNTKAAALPAKVRTF